MTIRSKLYIISVILITSVVLLGVVLLLASKQINDVSERHDVIREITKGVFELNIVTNDFLQTRQDRSKDQWTNKYNTLLELLTSEVLEQAEQTELESLEKLREGHKSLGLIFLDIITNFENEQLAENRQASIELSKRLSSQFSILSQNIVTEASRLTLEGENNLSKVQARANLIGLFFLIIILVIGITGSIVSILSISNPLLFCCL